MKKNQLLAIILTLLLALSTGCFSGPDSSPGQTTTAQTATGEGIPPLTGSGSTAATGITAGTSTSSTTPSGSEPGTAPTTQPKTQPATKPWTKPATKPWTKPATKPSSTGKYADISNQRYDWSYGYPESWVSQYSGYWNYGGNDLYLTLDLGYEMGYTADILDTLGEKGVLATFFVTTEYIQGEPGLVQRMLAEGHKVGNHSTGHRNMVDLVGSDGKELVANTEQWDQAFKALTGGRSYLYRAPEGVFSRRGMTVLHEMGYKTIFWGAAYADWDRDNQPSIETAKSKLYQHIEAGDVLLLHPLRTNAELMPQFIDDMRAKGYQFKLIP